MEYNLADLWERVVDAIPEREALVCGERRLTYAEADAAGEPARPPSRRPGHRPRRPRRALPLQRHRVPRGMLAAFKLRAVPDQRELPLRRGGAAVPARRLPTSRRSCSTASSRPSSTPCGGKLPSLTTFVADRGRRPAPSSTRRRRGRLRAGARRRVARRATSGRGPPTTSTSSTRAAPRACPRASCGAPRTSSSAPSAAANLGDAPITAARGDRRAVDPRAGRPLPAGVPVHARHRALDGASARSSPAARVVISPERSFDPARLWRAHRRGAGELPRHRRRRLRPPAGGGARRARPGGRRDVAARVVALRRRGAVAVGEGRGWAERCPARSSSTGSASSETAARARRSRRRAATAHERARASP